MTTPTLREQCLIPVADLVPYARNARTHSPAQVAQLAASIREFGWTNPVLIDEAGGIIAGHGRVLAARELGMQAVPCLRLTGLTEAQKRAYVLADNQLALNAGWDDALLAEELAALGEAEFDLGLIGFDSAEVDRLLRTLDAPEPDGAADAVPELRPDAVTQPGDLWLLGDHRLLCGDSTREQDVARLMGGRTAQLLHADPPYGMGKESEGVANDNLYAAKLDQFQMAWWSAFRPFLDSNASAYIWGNAPDLWRLWYVAGLGNSERMELRNELVWDKRSIAGMASPELTQFPIASERCLFFQLGHQFIGSVNTDDFPDTWEPLRSYMESQARSAGITPADIRRVCGVGMYSHWFTRAQFVLIAEPHYRALAQAYPGHFARPWRELKAEWDRVKGAPRSAMYADMAAARSYFDNAHDVMRDVWEFPRVTGEERHGHATPKPVAMMERAIKSACPPGGLMAEPFGGTGSTLIGAHTTGRVCYLMEISPHYCDVIVRRWQDYTGQVAVHADTGEPFPTP